MITDTNPAIRYQGYEKIRSIRLDPPTYLREFRTPKGYINFNAKTYDDAIMWNDLQVTEPPCLYLITDEQLVHYQYSSHETIELPGTFIKT